MVDIRHPPADLDQLVDWLEHVSYNLVLLEEYSLAEIRSALDTVTRAVEQHRGSPLPRPEDRAARHRALATRANVLESDHVWFGTSLEQLWWLYGVVERDNHGGHRQALGQYGRLLAESLRRHRADEREYLRQVAVSEPRSRPTAAPGNSN